MTANSNNHNRHAGPGKPSLIELKGMDVKFLIVNRPAQATLQQFVKDLKSHNVKVVVRCCEPSYSEDTLTESGIRVVDLPFDDGAAPPFDVIKKWMELVKSISEESAESCIAVHCVAGLGRAPVLVAVALVEHGLKYHVAVEKIREKRRGAFNQKQLQFLESYKPMNKGKSCSIM